LLTKCSFIALEKRDGESIARLKNTQQISALKAVRDVEMAVVVEAKGSIDSLMLNKAVTQEKYDFFSSQSYMNVWEITATTLQGMYLAMSAAIALGYALSGGLKLIPDFMAGGAGFGGSPTVNATIGGSQVGNGAEMAVATLNQIAGALDKAARMASTQASYRQRKDD
jgi:hypothetical protein